MKPRSGAGVSGARISDDEGMAGDVNIKLDAATAAVLLDWLQREDGVDGFKWAAARPGDRVALSRLLIAAREAALDGVDPTQARRQLEAALPPESDHGIPEDVLRRAPEDLRRRLALRPPGDIVHRFVERLEMLGVSHTGVGWRNDGEHGYLEVGLDPYSEDTARRVRLMCEPVEVRFVEGPRRPRFPFGYSPDET